MASMQGDDTKRILKKFLEDPLDEFFTPVVIERGQTLWNENRVQMVTIKGLEVTAFVLGEDGKGHKVTISLDMARELTNECSCSLGGNCEHVVAVLRSIREEKWRTDLKNHVKVLTTNPLGINIVMARERPQEITDGLQYFFESLADGETGNVLKSCLIGFFTKNVECLTALAQYLERHGIERQVGLRSGHDEKTGIQRLVEILDDLVEHLADSIFLVAEYWHDMPDWEVDDCLTTVLNDAFQELYEVFDGFDRSFKCSWPTWKRVFVWWENSVTRTIRETISRLDEWDEFYPEDFLFLLEEPLDEFLFRFFQSCWWCRDELTEEYLVDIIVQLVNLIERYRGNPEWTLAIFIALDPSEEVLNAARTSLFTSTTMELSPEQVVSLQEHVGFLIREGRKKSLLRVAESFTTIERVTSFLDFLEQTEYRDDKELKYQLILSHLQRDWLEFHELFDTLFDLKDLTNFSFVTDLISLFKATHSLGVMKETLTQVKKLGDQELLMRVQESFLEAAREFSHEIYIRALLAMERNEEAAREFFITHHERFFRQEKISSSEDYFLMDVLPRIMIFDVDKSVQLIKRLMELHVACKQRSRYQKAAKWAMILKKLLVEEMKRKEEWTRFIQDFLERYRRRPALQDEMRKVLRVRAFHGF